MIESKIRQYKYSTARSNASCFPFEVRDEERMGKKESSKVVLITHSGFPPSSVHIPSVYIIIIKQLL